MRRLLELADLSGRTALITGGAGHLGQTFARALCELGADVALADRDGDKVACVAETIAKDFGGRCAGIEVDLVNEGALRELPSQVAERFGSLDILINNAAFVGTDKLKGWNVPFDLQSSETWRAAVEINLTAPFFLSQAALPWLKAKKRGSVINLGSIYGFLGPDLRLYEGTEMNNAAAYGAAKGGLVQATRWLATVLAPDVRVNCVSPGGVWRDQPESFVTAYEARTPMGRMAREEDFAGVIAYLASDLSSYMTGQHLAVDGGWSAW